MFKVPWLSWGLVAAVLLLTAMSLWQYSARRVMHVDELVFLERGQFWDWYVQGELDRPEWQSYASYDVPKFAEFFYGAVLRFISGKSAGDFLEEKGFFLPGTRKITLWGDLSLVPEMTQFPSELKPRIEVLLTTRRAAMIAFTFPSLILITLISLLIKDRLAGVITVLLIGFNALFRNTMVMAVGDSALLFFNLSFFVLALWWLKRWSQDQTQRLWWLSLVMGVVAGLAISTKLNGVLTLVFWSILLVWIAWKKHFKSGWWLARHFLVTLSVAYAVFIVINPVTWVDPLGKTYFMAKHRFVTFQEQQQEEPDRALVTLTQRITRVFNNTVMPGETNLTLRNNDWPTDLFFVVIGSGWLLQQVGLLPPRVRKQGSPLPPALKILYQRSFIVWFITIITVSTLFLPLDWDRYYLPPVVMVTFLQGFAIAEFIQLMWRRLTNPDSAPSQGKVQYAHVSLNRHRRTAKRR